LAGRSFGSGTTLRWLVQAGFGIALVVLLAIHLIVNHWAAPQGLLTYADVLRYYDVPGIAWMEIIFLVVVTCHCLLGIHGILLDLNLRPGPTRSFTLLLIVAGGLVIMYGIWIVRTVALLSVS
jgi:succinate dehydrogenase hydrophobic anchor subunit